MDLARMLLDVFRNSPNNLVRQVPSPSRIPEFVGDMVPKPWPELLERIMDRRFYQLSFHGAASIELWYSLEIVPAATGHNATFPLNGLVEFLVNP